MALNVLHKKIWFPPVTDALEDGLLALGGDLSTERLLAAYKKGIFPWYDGDVPLWWCPDPRFVLYPHELKVSKSMSRLLKQQAFTFTVNTAFEKVIDACQQITRPNQDGTWINDELKQSYIHLHHLGYAHSAEVWKDGELAGGLYGVRLGKIFFGESMFSAISNASKYAFMSYVHELIKEGVALIDCQVYTDHLASLGARMISRDNFIHQLKDLIS
ncbi:MAG: leucyl/phenylalanyl-tRNA--protein transferase [Ilyomonas sp.]